MVEQLFLMRLAIVLKQDNVKVWHYVDNSIGKMIDMFATTWDNKPIDIPPLYIERK